MSPSNPVRNNPPARLVGVLVLLFGQKITNLAVLPRTALTVDDDGRVSLALSGTPIRLREPLASLAWRSLATPNSAARPGCFPAARATAPCRPNGCVNGCPHSG
jgi:hypothetical protein